MTVEKLMKLDEKREYLIPDILPHPSVILIYGAGGDGKSTAAWAIAKHIVSGKPFRVRGADVPIQQGPVLLLNGDQPLIQLKEQLIEADFPITDQTFIQTDWQLQRYAQFIKLMEDHKPKLVVIDSDWLLWWSRFDENKSDFATRFIGSLKTTVNSSLLHHPDHSPRQQEWRLPWHLSHSRCSG